MGETIRQMHENGREDVAQFAFEAIEAMVNSTGGPEGMRRPVPDPGFRQVLIRSGIDPGDFARRQKQARAQDIRMDQQPGAIHSFKDLMMPALVRVGAVTDRTRELFRAEEIPVYEDASVLSSIEDAETGAVAQAAD